MNNYYDQLLINKMKTKNNAYNKCVCSSIG